MDFFTSGKGKKDGKRSRLFGKSNGSRSYTDSPPRPTVEKEYDFPEQTSYQKQPASERLPNSHPRRPPVSERRRERIDVMNYEASSPFHPSPNPTPERPRKSSEYSRQQHQDTRSNASPFHPFKSPSPSPYHTHGTDHYEAMYEPEDNIMFPPSPFHPAAAGGYTTPDGRSKEETHEDLYEPEPDGDVTPPRSPVHGFPYYSSSDDDNYLYPEIATPSRSTPVHHNYQIVVTDTYDHAHDHDHENQNEPPELPDESQSFSLQEIAKMRGLKEETDQSMISDAYVTVANYRVKLSVAETLQAIIDKHGDIAAASKLESMVTRSYYLESLATVVMELKGTVLRDLSKARMAEMAAVVKDMESVKIDVTWLKKAVVELTEAVECFGEYEVKKAEREVCERQVKERKAEMEEMREELGKREKEMRECREKVTVVAGNLGKLEMKGSKLNKNLQLLHSKVHHFQGESVLLHL